MHSFYLAPEKWTIPLSLEGSEAHHLSRVLRIKSGTEIRLFDGQGKEATCIVEQINKNLINLQLVSETFTALRYPHCTLAAAFTKALRRSWFLEKASELEAKGIWFWQGENSYAKLPENEKESWQNTLIAGAKQCENPYLPELQIIQGGASALSKHFSSFDKVFFLYEKQNTEILLSKEDLMSCQSILFIIGPEGGFSSSEVQLIQEAGAQTRSLGKQVLRWETAAIMSLGLAWWAKQ